MKADPVAPSVPSWQALVVVCKDCQKRGSGPKRLKAKDVVQSARMASKAERPRPRVIVSGCLGLCPKRAIAVARVDAASGARLVAAASADDVVALAKPAVPDFAG